MSFQQVRFLLGSPTVTDPLNPQRWDYIYNYIPGTYAKKQNSSSTWATFKSLF
jgi:outer membrane protein assembly factor BamE